MAGRSRFDGWRNGKDRSVESHGHRYLQIVAPVNEVVSLFNTAPSDSFKGGVIHALSVVLGDLTSEIENAAWPPEAHDAVAQLVAAANAARSAATALLSDLTNAAARVFAIEVEAMTDASSEMRSVLGLPAPGERTDVRALGLASTSLA